MNYYIYKIINLIDGKTYIGQRQCPKNKTPENDPYMGSGVYIRRAEKKYGMENFKKEILARNVETKEMIDELEISYIKYERMKAHYGIIPGCYNIANGGEGCSGLHMSAEAKAKLSAVRKGKMCGIDNGMYGRHHSAETRAKIGAANKRRHNWHWHLENGKRVYYSCS